jgi:hypothetical protein
MPLLHSASNEHIVWEQTIPFNVSLPFVQHAITTEMVAAAVQVTKRILFQDAPLVLPEE